MIEARRPHRWQCRQQGHLAKHFPPQKKMGEPVKNSASPASIPSENLEKPKEQGGVDRGD